MAVSHPHSSTLDPAVNGDTSTTDGNSSYPRHKTGSIATRETAERRRVKRERRKENKYYPAPPPTGSIATLKRAEMRHAKREREYENQNYPAPSPVSGNNTISLTAFLLTPHHHANMPSILESTENPSTCPPNSGKPPTHLKHRHHRPLKVKPWGHMSRVALTPSLRPPNNKWPNPKKPHRNMTVLSRKWPNNRFEILQLLADMVERRYLSSSQNQNLNENVTENVYESPYATPEDIAKLRDLVMRKDTTWLTSILDPTRVRTKLSYIAEIEYYWDRPIEVCLPERLRLRNHHWARQWTPPAATCQPAALLAGFWWPSEVLRVLAEVARVTRGKVAEVMENVNSRVPLEDDCVGFETLHDSLDFFARRAVEKAAGRSYDRMKDLDEHRNSPIPECFPHQATQLLVRRNTAVEGTTTALAPRPDTVWTFEMPADLDPGRMGSGNNDAAPRRALAPNGGWFFDPPVLGQAAADTGFAEPMNPNLTQPRNGWRLNTQAHGEPVVEGEELDVKEEQDGKQEEKQEQEPGVWSMQSLERNLPTMANP
ncbi:hypothetical protein K402DRAFT_216319 [Aulographum hederae CBS 113979]|uniref:Uncharacterized protein n=1 Tax=Aulographum hederae CBS 113979 TaxID=1176131 RepID=A0A6G1GM37_9PEZI|nr:hypothetical protein K402DRAFT_216319 [Aulographum hederae CBS 113979]